MIESSIVGKKKDERVKEGEEKGQRGAGSEEEERRGKE